MRAGKQVRFEDDIVVVLKGKEVVYRGMEDYEPMRREMWEFIETTKDGKGYYKFGKYKKYFIG